MLGLNPEIAFHSWDREFVLYDRASGDTRLLDHLGGRVVELLGMQAHAREALECALRQQEGNVPAEEWKAEFNACLDGLLALSVILPQAPR